MDESKAQPKEILEIFEGTWELIITNQNGKKKSYKVVIDNSLKYLQNDEYEYDFQAVFVEEKIRIQKKDISNRANQTIEVIDYISDDKGILSGIDDKENEIKYIKRG